MNVIQPNGKVLQMFCKCSPNVLQRKTDFDSQKVVGMLFYWLQERLFGCYTDSQKGFGYEEDMNGVNSVFC